MRSPGGALGQILEQTRARVAASRAARPLDAIKASIHERRIARRSFESALKGRGGPRVIAEIKRRSPSKGALREGLDPAAIAHSYEHAGAAAISVLTEPSFFGGSLEDLERARRAAHVPILRKDFIVDAYQIWEARRAGADAALLIAAALEDEELASLLRVADEAEIDALVEVHDREELDRSIAAGARIIGVNSRDLRTLAVRLETALELAPFIPDEIVTVAESGIRGPADVRRLAAAGFDAFLVGEHLMRAEDPGAALAEMIGSAGESKKRARKLGPVAVKICGITTTADAMMAADAGADLIGLIFWPGSRRRVDRKEARRISAVLPAYVERVGVFVDAPRDEIVRAVEEIGLDAVQLHGSEPPDALCGLPARVIKAARVGPGFQAEDIVPYIGCAEVILLDAASPAGPGGNGVAFDWSIAAELREVLPSLMLAGGLTQDNVIDAIETVRPGAVDVSSGVEASPGRKDPAKVRAFIEAARRAGARIASDDRSHSSRGPR